MLMPKKRILRSVVSFGMQIPPAFLGQPYSYIGEFQSWPIYHRPASGRAGQSHR